MPMDEVIRTIEQASTEEIQDLLQSVIGRYRELYPDWRILFVSVDQNATDEQSREVLKFVDKINHECG